jgi:hypothetical protein
MAVQNYGSGGGGFQVSPGISVSEIDLTTVVPAVSTTVGAIAGVFRWGPTNARVLVSSENDLVAKFGKPTNINPETFFTAANFLAYSNALYVARAGNSNTTFSAIANTAAFSANAAHTIENEDDYSTKDGNFDTSVAYIARCPGALGNSLRVSVCESSAQYNSSVDLRNANSNTSFNNANTKITLAVGSNTATVTLANSASLTGDTPLAHANTVSHLFITGDYIEVGNSSIGKQKLKITAIGSVAVVNTAGTNTGTATFTLSLNQPMKLSTAIDANTVPRYWEFHSQVDVAPGQSSTVTNGGNTAAYDELHVIVTDEDGGFTGSPGQVLEVFKGISRATDSVNESGESLYYKTVINNKSNYVWWASDHSGAVSNTAVNVISSTNSVPLNISFQGGVDVSESALAFADVARAYDLFNNPENCDISLIMTGSSRGGTNGEQLANYIIDNIAEVRKDCVAFVSPMSDDVVNQHLSAADNVVTFRNSLRSTSYGVMDSGYKYQLDKYNNVYRWIPLNGDIAGLCVYTDNVRDPWYSPAGATRGNIKNVVKLAFTPSKAERDLLYKNGVNPVINQPGQGPMLFGDKTLLAKPSAFDRINVRRLFIVLEKAVAVAAKSFLFEFNDAFSRSQFVNLVEPYLRDVQGRRGIYDFKVVCDESNNSGQVVDSNRLVGDIYIKPAKSVNYIQLNFVAVRSGIEFSTITG